MIYDVIVLTFGAPSHSREMTQISVGPRLLLLARNFSFLLSCSSCALRLVNCCFLRHHWTSPRCPRRTLLLLGTPKPTQCTPMSNTRPLRHPDRPPNSMPLTAIATVPTTLKRTSPRHPHPPAAPHQSAMAAFKRKSPQALVPNSSSSAAAALARSSLTISKT